MRHSRREVDTFGVILFHFWSFPFSSICQNIHKISSCQIYCCLCRSLALFIQQLPSSEKVRERFQERCRSVNLRGLQLCFAANTRPRLGDANIRKEVDACADILFQILSMSVFQHLQEQTQDLRFSDLLLSEQIIGIVPTRIQHSWHCCCCSTLSSNSSKLLRLCKRFLPPVRTAPFQSSFMDKLSVMGQGICK